MKMLVGLGNPGERYRHNRHNAGFMFVDKFVEQSEAGRWDRKFESDFLRKDDLIFLKPQTFMNKSGEAIRLVTNFYKLETSDIFLIHDDLDLRLGEYKIQKGIGPKVHNGVSSVEDCLGTKDFWRIRIGVDNRESGATRTPGEVYVLEDFTKDELTIFHDTLQKLCGEVRKLLV